MRHSTKIFIRVLMIVKERPDCSYSFPDYDRIENKKWILKGLGQIAAALLIWIFLYLIA